MSPSPADSASPALAQELAIPAQLLEDGEIIILAVKPHGWFVAIVSWPVILVAALVAAGTCLAGSGLNWRLPQQAILFFCLAVACARIVGACFQWLGRMYILTNRRLIWVYGVTHFNVVQCPLNKVRQVDVTASQGERLLGLGSLSFAVADEKFSAGVWANLARPLAVKEAIIDAIGRCGRK